jgi:hypothetical protein
LSLDEGCCPWKGRLRFRCYNPNKPAKFHIKLFQIAEAKSGYVLGFNIYTGKDSCLDENISLDPVVTTTTKTVLTLASKCNVLDKGHTIYFDNYYTSPELLEELLYRDTLCCGTVRSNRKGLPKSVTSAKLKKGECCFRRKFTPDGEPLPILALKWCDKRPVYMLSSLHAATEVWSGKKQYLTGNPVYKPKCVVDYTARMGGVDTGDMMMNNYHFLRKSVKWWQKLFVHIVNMLLMNAYLLNKKYGSKQMSHIEFREYIAQHLVFQATGQPEQDDPTEQENIEQPVNRFVGRHFPNYIPCQDGKKRSALSCKVCFVGKKESKDRGLRQRRKMTMYMCHKCNIAMCITPCFRIYHEEKNYKEVVLNL